ncbi:MAG: hypothetical protein ACTHMS_05780 [Jatrophihabitans sp.]|uniref:hypothetical protein n=1 Tax=Jatrophihabitans sp. TaxID=1932789 RepID=UPI003F80686D
MAHFVAEKILAAESATSEERAAAEQAAAESILALWGRRAALPMRQRPLESYQQVFLALDRLGEPKKPWRFYRLFDAHSRPSADDTESTVLLQLAIDVESTTRDLVVALVSEAASLCQEREAAWVRIGRDLVDDDEQVILGRLDQLAKRGRRESHEVPDAPLDRVRDQLVDAAERFTAIANAIDTQLRNDGARSD